MLTIGQLAAYAGVTVRAVRHYHKIGLLPEPGRDHSGYRVYDAAAVTRLIRIHTLAEAGVPLARVQELLDADPDEFARAVTEIDAQLRADIHRLRTTRKRMALLAAGDHLALPDSVVGYLDRLRALGIDERYVAMEGDAWIIIAAQMPAHVDDLIATKNRELDDPDMVGLYRLLSQAVEWEADDPRIIGIVDHLERMIIRSLEDRPSKNYAIDASLINLLDAAALESSPIAETILRILEERGWRGWTAIERVSPDGSPPGEGRPGL